MQPLNNDTVLRSRLNELQQAPAEMRGDFTAVWNKLEIKLEAPKKRSFAPWLIAAAFILISMMTYVLFQNQTVQKQAIVIPQLKEKQRIFNKTDLAIRVVQNRNEKNNSHVRKAIKKIIRNSAKAGDVNKLTTAETAIIANPIKEVLPERSAEIVRVNATLQIEKPKLKILHQNELMPFNGLQETSERMRLTKLKEEKQPLKISTSLFPVWSNKSTSPISEN